MTWLYKFLLLAIFWSCSYSKELIIYLFSNVKYSPISHHVDVCNIKKDKLSVWVVIYVFVSSSLGLVSYCVDFWASIHNKQFVTLKIRFKNRLKQNNTKDNEIIVRLYVQFPIFLPSPLTRPKFTLCIFYNNLYTPL